MKLKKDRKSNKTHNSTSDRLTTVLFATYLIVLIWIILFKFGVRFSYMEYRSVNLIPFAEYFSSTGKIDLSEIILNVIIFIPLGVYSGILFNRWTLSAKLFLFFLISFLFEGLQYAIRIGAFDLTDIITNVFGGVTGLIVYEVVAKIIRNRGRAQKFVNAIAVTGTVVIITLLVMLKLNMLPVRYQ